MTCQILSNVYKGTWKGDKISEKIIEILFEEIENIQQKIDALSKEEEELKEQIYNILKKKTVESLSYEEKVFLGINPNEFFEIDDMELYDDIPEENYGESDDCAGNNCIFCANKCDCDDSEYMDQD